MRTSPKRWNRWTYSLTHHPKFFRLLDVYVLRGFWFFFVLVLIVFVSVFILVTLFELLRQLMERQALRRMETGTLTDEEVERLGETFMKLEQRMEELKRHFELEDEDLNLNLGPLGDLL